MGIYDLDRNDVEGAARVYRDLRERGEATPERCSMLLQLQDDQSELRRRMAMVDATLMH